VSEALNQRLVGNEQTVLVCGENEDGRLYGRLASQAPEIDGVVYLRGQAPGGAVARVRITSASAYDVAADLLRAEVDEERAKTGVDTAGEYL
jgi:ribosomal protein S12 methylthiotransferase